MLSRNQSCPLVTPTWLDEFIDKWNALRDESDRLRRFPDEVDICLRQLGSRNVDRLFAAYQDRSLSAELVELIASIKKEFVNIQAGTAEIAELEEATQKLSIALVWKIVLAVALVILPPLALVMLALHSLSQ